MKIIKRNLILSRHEVNSKQSLMSQSKSPTVMKCSKGVSQELIDELSKADYTVLTFAIVNGKSVKIKVNPINQR